MIRCAQASTATHAGRQELWHSFSALGLMSTGSSEDCAGRARPWGGAGRGGVSGGGGGGGNERRRRVRSKVRGESGADARATEVWIALAYHCSTKKRREAKRNHLVDINISSCLASQIATRLCPTCPTRPFFCLLDTPWAAHPYARLRSGVSSGHTCQAVRSHLETCQKLQATIVESESHQGSEPKAKPWLLTLSQTS